jgi:hypothetical protein
MDIDSVFEFYRAEFVPAYSDLVGYIGDKPQQTLIELENTLAHIAQHFNPRLDTKDRDKNLEKAYKHLVRVTLDCYKLLWVTIYERLEAIDKNKFNRKLGLNISEEDFRTKFQKLRKLAQEARRIEMTSLGLAPIAALNKYKEVVKDGYELIDTIDENKMQEIKSQKRFISTKEFMVGTAVGILAGLISGYLLSLVTAAPVP